MKYKFYIFYIECIKSHILDGSPTVCVTLFSELFFHRAADQKRKTVPMNWYQWQIYIHINFFSLFFEVYIADFESSLKCECFLLLSIFSTIRIVFSSGKQLPIWKICLMVLVTILGALFSRKILIQVCPDSPIGLFP